MGKAEEFHKIRLSKEEGYVVHFVNERFNLLFFNEYWANQWHSYFEPNQAQWRLTVLYCSPVRCSDGLFLIVLVPSQWNDEELNKFFDWDFSSKALKALTQKAS